MIDFFIQLSPVWQALIATTFTWFVTALGAAAVFLFKEINRKMLDGTLGFAAGVMIAASYWSLLAPALEMAETITGLPVWVPAAAGFLLGGGFIRLIDLVLPHLHLGFPMSEAEGIHTRCKRSILLLLAITLHNFPEVLAIGVASLAVALWAWKTGQPGWRSVAMTAVVLWGTIYPLVMQAVRGIKAQVGPPFFQSLMVPLTVLLLLTVAICPLLAWRHQSLKHLRRNFLVPVSALSTRPQASRPERRAPGPSAPPPLPARRPPAR